MTNADGVNIFDFKQAQDATRRWFDQSTGVVRRKHPYTVGDALDDYIANYQGKALASTKNRIGSVIRPVLGHIEVAKLT